MSTKLDEIYAVVLPAMAAKNITDTPKNRLDFLTGMREAWLEDGTVSFEKWLWLMAVGNEILRLRDVVANQD